MDEKYLELADAVTTTTIQAGINRARQKQKIPKDFDGCCSCGADIPEERIAAGYFNCVPCQTLKERHIKMHRGD